MDFGRRHSEVYRRRYLRNSAGGALADAAREKPAEAAKLQEHEKLGVEAKAGHAGSGVRGEHEERRSQDGC